MPRLTPRPLPNGPSKGTKILIGVVLALVVVVGLFFGLSQFITDLMWYGQLGFQNVVWTQLGVKFGLWAAYALLMALVSYVSAWLAIRARPDSSDGSTFRIKDDVIEVGKSFSSKTARRAAVVVSLVVGVMFGSQFNSNWSEILLMFNAQSFGTTDPQFGIDNGFYVFVLPGLRLVMSAVSMLLLMGIVFSVVTHAMMGGIRFTMPVHGRGVLAVTKRARRQIGIWLILNMLAWSARQVIGVFTHLTQQGDRITGAAIHHRARDHSGHVHHGGHHRDARCVPRRVADALPCVGRRRQAECPRRRGSQGVAYAGDCDRRRAGRLAGAHRRMADAAAAVQGEPERAGDGIHLYPAQHQRHEAGVRARQGEGRTVQGHHQGRVRSAVVRGRIHRADPTARPTGRQPHVQAAAAVEAVLHVRRHAGRRQVRHRRRQPGHG